VGLLAVGARSVFVRIKESSHAKAEASSAWPTPGSAVAAVSIAPLLLFAFLWRRCCAARGHVAPERLGVL